MFVVRHVIKGMGGGSTKKTKTTKNHKKKRKEKKKRGKIISRMLSSQIDYSSSELHS